MHLFPGDAQTNEQSETYSLANFSSKLKSQNSFVRAGGDGFINQDIYMNQQPGGGRQQSKGGKQKIVSLYSSSKVRPYSAKTTIQIPKQAETGIVGAAYNRYSSLTSGNYGSKTELHPRRTTHNNNWVDLPEFPVQADRYQNQQQNHLYAENRSGKCSILIKDDR